MREGRIPASLLSTRASSRPSAARIRAGWSPAPLLLCYSIPASLTANTPQLSGVRSSSDRCPTRQGRCFRTYSPGSLLAIGTPMDLKYAFASESPERAPAAER